MRLLNKFSTRVLLAFILTGCAAEQREQQLNAKISNQSSEMRSLQGRLDDIEKRLDKGQDQSADLQQNFKQERADLQVLVDDLRTVVNQLRGSQEEINHNLDLLKVD